MNDLHKTVLGVCFMGLLAYAMHLHPEGHKLLTDPVIAGILVAVIVGGGALAAIRGKS